MSNLVFTKENFIIFSVSKGFIVYNKDKTFAQGHTHIKDFKCARSIVYYAKYKKVPSGRSKYILESLLRVSVDRDYIRRLEERIKIIGGKK